jgi:hypothetical protein
MDPLSITAAVIALATVAVQVTHILKAVNSSSRDAPKVAERALREVQDFSAIIFSIKGIIENLKAARKDRLSLIEVEPLVVTLTDAGITFSEFNAVLDGFNRYNTVAFKKKSSSGRANRALQRLAERVSRHEVSLSLMLNVIQWYDCTRPLV